jgi:diacylglycerol kinase family enzyme
VNERPGCPIAAVPAGTENLFARHFHFNGSPDRLVNALVRGESRDVDLGCAQGRLFTLMAGFGFDADIVSRHHAARVRSNGDAGPTSRAAYMEPILKASVHYRFPEIQVAIDAPEELGQISGTSVLVFNLPRYALGLPFAPSARDDDGYLDLVVFRKPGPWNALRYLWLVFRRLHLARRGIIHKRVRRVRISASSAVPIQLDGDPAGELQPGVENAWTLEAVPGGLRVVSIRKRKHNSTN